MGKKRTPAPKVNPPISATLAAPMTFADSSTVTKAAITRS